MDRAGAVGLDLSFVSYVFLLEPIEDMSLYKQIVSRAHRLGAKSAVHVEILVMKVCKKFYGDMNISFQNHIPSSKHLCKTVNIDLEFQRMNLDLFANIFCLQSSV